MTSIASTVDVTNIGTQTGVAAVDFFCTLGTGARGVNECRRSFLFDGTIHAKTGTYRADMFNWIAGGEDGFTSAKSQMVRRSGTGGFSNLITLGGDLLRDEAAATVGALVGEFEFDVIVIPPSTLIEFTVSELFVMEAEGAITVEESVAELNLRATSK